MTATDPRSASEAGPPGPTPTTDRTTPHDAQHPVARDLPGRPLVLARTDELTRDAWLEVRRHGIGGSDAAAAVGVDPWRSPWQLYLDKRGELPDREATEPMRWGQRLEPVIADAFTEETGIPTRRRRAVLAHPEHPWMLANLDRTLDAAHAPDGHTGRGVLEIKAVSAWKREQWSDHDAPIPYVLQLQHAYAVTGATWGYLAALIGGQELRVVEVPRDDALIGELVDVERRLWERVQSGDPPPVDGLATTTDHLARMFPRAVPDRWAELDDDGADAARRYVEAKRDADDADARKRQAANELRAALGDAEVGYLPGDTPDAPSVRWSDVTSQRLDTKKLRAEEPDVADRFTTTTVSRRLTVRSPDPDHA